MMLLVFPNFNFLPVFSLLLYDLLSDLRPIFLYEFKLNQSAVETARKTNQATYSNPGQGFEDPGGD